MTPSPAAIKALALELGERAAFAQGYERNELLARYILTEVVPKAVAAEREACAKACDLQNETHLEAGMPCGAGCSADAIRARSGEGT